MVEDNEDGEFKIQELDKDSPPPKVKRQTAERQRHLHRIALYRAKRPRNPVGRPKGSGKKKKRNVSREVREARAENMRRKRAVMVTLTMQHDRNGHIYGPGTMAISADLAQDLLHTEAHARAVETQFHTPRGMIIGGRSKTGAHVTRQVPMETFDTSLVTAEPFEIIKSKGG